MSRLILRALGLCLVLFGVQLAQAVPPSEEPSDPSTIMLDFELSERQIVEAASKTRTTIQQAPAIITVITAKEIRARGYRSLNDLLNTIPGFEGDRWEFYGWYRDNLTRGNPRTALVLLNGVNIVGPIRNTLDLDRKLPLSLVKRIEVTSGPGSVLWGSNALLGVVNIITFDGHTKPGFDVRIGGGDGPGEKGALSAQAHWGGTFWDDKVSLYLNASYFTSRGPILTVDAQKIYGPLPAPSGDSVSLFVPEPGRTTPYDRDQVLSLSGSLGVGDLTLGWFSGIDREFRELGVGGSLTTEDYRVRVDEAVSADQLVAKSTDHLHSVYLRYTDRFDNQRLGLSAQAQFVTWSLHQKPFGIFPRSDFPFLKYGATTTLDTDRIYRAGINVDLDYTLPYDNHLLMGAEIFVDATDDVILTTFDPVRGPDTAPDKCRFPFVYRPDRDPIRPCSLQEVGLIASDRLIGAIYATDEWRVGKQLAITGGIRGQFSTTYDPTALVSAGLVYGITNNVFFKATYGEGFRPPDFQSTSATSGIASGVSFEANPNLSVERSRAVEMELNARLFENTWPVRQWYLRADYSYTQMDGIITFPAGRYENAGDRDVHSVEALSKVVFYGDHELWLSYYFVDVIDADMGRLRNIANHVVNAGGTISLLDGHLQLSSVVTIRGEMEDLNRSPHIVWDGPPFALDPESNINQVAPTGTEVTHIPTVTLLRFGVEAQRLFGHWNIGGWVYNALNTSYSDPDYFFDDRITSRPQPKPGFSFFMETSVQW